MIFKDLTYRTREKQTYYELLCTVIQQFCSTPLNKAGNIYQLLPYFQSLVEPVPWYTKKEVRKNAKFPLGLILAAAAAFGPSSRKHLSMDWTFPHAEVNGWTYISKDVLGHFAELDLTEMKRKVILSWNSAVSISLPPYARVWEEQQPKKSLLTDFRSPIHPEHWVWSFSSMRHRELLFCIKL